MTRKSKIRWGTLAVIAGGVVSALGDPSVIGYLPHKLAIALTVASVVVAGVKKAVVREEHERVE